MPNFPVKLYSTDDIRRIERAATSLGTPGYTLMTRAGIAAANRLRARWPSARNIVVWCGTGNNGGDGYVVARSLHEAGLGVQIVQVGDPNKIVGEALLAREAAISAGLIATPFVPSTSIIADVHVDALLGIGLSGRLSDPMCNAISTINTSGGPILAIDIPSGLNADTGGNSGCAVNATLTITFLALKRGLCTGDAAVHCGEVILDELEIPAACFDGIHAQTEYVVNDEWNLTRRLRNAHKGHYGHVLVCGGAPGFAGATLLTARAALRCGAGLVSVATHPAHASQMFMATPELMCHAISVPAELTPLMRHSSLIAVGPGLGQHAWGSALWQKILENNSPMVVDADALNLLAQNPVRRDDWVLTPHPGEAARLLNITVSDVQRDRYNAVYAIQEAYGGVCVLKGSGTLVCGTDKRVRVCEAGNPGMATAGMGDVLTGVIAAIMAQRIAEGPAPAEIVAQAVYLHACAGDLAARAGGERGLMATEVVDQLRGVVNGHGTT